ncbi:ABC transporter permease [Nonomuraea angiospora]|uniref:ABC-type transport system involved in multi-copper enzyme maturation permease subunit n=1 Tax=Nonomuraea angiospora TaxID=46172 RepID=A0ABR9M0J8_9ACTN|nr:ABC transporter permease [Nonomuraea angiospora]MBE1586432.1 ABC-type transport system involved in multi-copper enzyme maturation permease subunit [Nonomuraea angiospora]
MSAIAAEWIKLRTLRSTWWALGVGVLVALAMTVLGASTVIARWDPGRTGDQAAMGVVVAVYVGVVLAQLPFGMMGAMTISGEYTSGMIDATLVATPSRGRVLAAKAVVLSGTAVAGSLLIAVPGYLYGRFLAAEYHPSLLPAGAWTVVAGGTLMIVVATLLGLSLGVILRNGAVATAVLVTIVLLLPFAGLVLPGGVWVNRLLPGYPALQLIEQVPAIMPTWAAFTVLAGWAVVPLLAAWRRG